MKNELTPEYKAFLNKNRVKINGYLNKVLWFFILAGPAIAAGILGGIFPDISYITCICISAFVAVMAAIHLLLLKQYSTATFTCVFVLAGLNLVLLYMSCSHVSIYITWFLVPLLSLLFCDKYIYIYAVIQNFILMGIAEWINAPYKAALNTNYASASDYFLDRISGFTIEYIIMLAAGFIIEKLILGYFKNLLEQNQLIGEQEKTVEEKVDILDSMAEIYDNVNLIDFVNSTETSLRDPEHHTHGIDMTAQTHTLMNQRLKKQVMPDMLDEFLAFTNIKTVRARLSHKKLISADFIDVVSGWFRAQYITVDSTLDGIPNIVIYTTRNVDAEKRREEHLIRISMTDEMTRLFNRRCYDEDLREYRNGELSEDFVLFSIDVNGLKTVNDTKGHAAGDELIKGAADCLALSVGNKGKVYRTGGDEFMAVVYTKDPAALRNEILNKTKEWHGIYTEEITMSVGFAAHKEKPDAGVDDLEHIADADMYTQKEKFYKERGIERRR